MNEGALRAALSQVPTGVAVVSTLDASGRPVGLTANSVTSVGQGSSGLVWSLNKWSRSRYAFEECAVFGVSLLESGQVALARRMSSVATDRFADVDWFHGVWTHAPLVSGSIARFECRKTDTLEIGDHILFIGEIIAWQAAAGSPLCYLGGRYVRLERGLTEERVRGGSPTEDKIAFNAV